MRARVEEARAGDDPEELRAASVRLARWLASRDRDLLEAADLASAALGLGEEAELRWEVASWLESLGESARAAAVLKPLALDLDSVEAAYLLVRTGVLKARAGAGAAAAVAFETAMSIDSGDPLPAELFAGLWACEPEAVEPAAASEAYREAARRQRVARHPEAELEDLWRSLAADPSNDHAAEALAELLEEQGRRSAADEVRRACAAAVAPVDPRRAAKLHGQRLAATLSAHDLPGALGAALDLGLDAFLQGEGADSFDAILLDVGLLETVAARLEVRAQAEQEPSRRAVHLMELARLCAGPLADRDRALGAWISALAADPTAEDTIVALRAMLGAGERALAASLGVRSDPVRALAALASVKAVEDRRSEIAAELERVLGTAGIEPPLADDGSDGRAATARAWVRASVESDRAGAAVALERVSSSMAPALQTILCSAAARLHAGEGNSKAARRAAEAAVKADPTSARSVAVMADAVSGDGDRAAAAAVERAVSLIGPRADWCGSLLRALTALGERELAAGWTQRWVALSPGNREAIEQLLEVLAANHDRMRLMESVSWLLSQPQPAAWASEPLARALRSLSDVDPAIAVVAARRTLDVFGPKIEVLRDAVLQVAQSASDDAFAAAILERWLAFCPVTPERSGVFARLAELQRRLGDVEGEARVLARAARAGVSSEALDARIEELAADADVTANPDAQLWTLMARAERLASVDDPAAPGVWRALGAALWDLAEDRVGAVAAWEKAAHLAPQGGHATLALDLVAFAGAPFAFDYLVRLIEGEPDDRTAAKVAAEVGQAALSIGHPRLAFDLAARGVARCPARADVLALAERAVDGAEDRGALSALYDLVARRSLGRFGRRAAHYRGARFFDRTGERELALKHAAQAFYAVPSEGSSFHFLSRAAERAGDRTHAARTVEQVAQLARRPEARAGWLLRAASILGTGEEATRRRVEMLLAATVGAASVGTIALLRDAAREFLRALPEEREILEMRFGRAADAAVQHVEGPEGARVAITFAMTALELFGDADAGMSLLERAFGSDADVDEYAELARFATVLATAKNAGERVSTMLSTAEAPYGNVGVPALSVFAGVAESLGDDRLEARAAVSAAIRDPDSDALVLEADAAVRAVPELGERLAASVRSARRVEVLVARAHALVAEGAFDRAAPLFERAAGLSEGEDRAAIEQHLRATLEAAGRGAELEERVAQEAASDVSPSALRADRWMEIAERREARGDATGAVRALLEACKLDPGPLERYSALERVAETAGDDEARVLALKRIAERVRPDGKSAVFKRLARVQQRTGDPEAAEATWRQVLALDEHDEEADQAIESALASRGRYGDLVEHLSMRAERLRARGAPMEMLRAVRLRRAAILEQRLAREDDACAELAVLLSESPDNVGALRYLADLLERRGKFAQSAPLWRRAAKLEADPQETDDLEMRAGLASMSAHDPTMALSHAKRVLSRSPSRPDARALRVDAARALGSDEELGQALEAHAAGDVDPATRSMLLVESAQAAARAGDPESALERARRAADVAPDRATPQLLARGLEYRLRGAGTRDDAHRTIQHLGQVREPLSRNDAALYAFLLAEAIDAAEGAGAGLREIERARASVGAHPLLALGLAERLVARGDHAAALDPFREALQGSLLELRRPASVAIAAADAALQLGKIDDARQFLDVADRYEDAREAAQSRRALVVERQPPVSEAARLGSQGQAGALENLEAAVRRATTPGERARARLTLGKARRDLGDARGAEPLLWEALADGLVEAGDVLAPMVSSSGDRAPDLVRLRRQQALLEPGDAARLEALRAAALADEDRVYARAVEHVLRAFDPGAGPLPPPPLSHQPEQPGVFAVLVRPSMDAAGEALALLWEGAMQLFVRDAASYGITGVERVVPGPTSVIARLYETSMRLLGTARIPLFLSRAPSHGPAAQVALLSPPSVVLSGDAREDSTALRFMLGRAMSAALPQNVLRQGVTAREGAALVEALRAAFGSPEIGRRVDVHAARLAESFWQMVPARTQRRLQELLSGGIAPFEELLARAEQSGRRVGMFLAGDFGFAARVAVAETAPQLEQALSTANLRSVCEQSPPLTDLVRLAISREYADARWHVVAPPTQRGTMPSGRFSLF
jgi:tetratricopeptide (TPR) repeat protein